MKVKALLRLGALISLMAIGLCGCNFDRERTKKPTMAPTEEITQSPTEKPTQRPTEPEKPAVRKKVAITFDDGPHAENTEKLVEELDRYGFNATFFVIGKKIGGERSETAKAMKYAIEMGNEVGIHAYSHSVDYGESCTDADYESEIARTREAILNIVPDYDIKLMRPVKGIMTNERVRESEYAVIHWNIDTYDWKYTERGNEIEISENVRTIVDKVLNNIKEGDIVLMHEIYENSYEAAVIILEELYYRGYEVVTVSELIGDVCAGTRYYNFSAK